MHYLADSQLTFAGPARLTANQLFRATLTIRPGIAVKTGGRVVAAARHVSDFGEPQDDDPTAENFVRFDGPSGTTWQLGPPFDHKRHPWNRGIELLLTAGELAPDETLTLELAPVDAGCPGYRAQSFAEEAFCFRLGVDTDGSGDWHVAPPAGPGVEIVGAAASSLAVRVTQPTRSGRRTVCLKPEDAYGNVAGDAAGEVAILDDRRVLARVALQPGRASQVEIDLPDDGRWRRLTAVSDDGRFWSRSNPVGPSPVEGLDLFWGEIHGQSGLCDGTNPPASIYRYARTAAGLDFASVTSHDFELTAENWQEILKATRDAHQPGRFVTFPGYEWSGGHSQGGDNNVYFLGDEGPLIYSRPFPGYPAWDPAEGQVERPRDLDELIAELPDRDVMVVPHCGGRCCNLDFHDPRVMPLLEIHSCHRTYEHVADEALRRGLRMGFIGGSDDHRGCLGDSVPAAREKFFSMRNGLIGVWTDDLSRESLWEAFFARRVYATTGCRLALTASVNDTFMGGQLTVPAGEPITVRFWARLDGWLDRAEVLRAGQVAERFLGEGNQVEEFDGEFTESAPEGNTPYVVRIRQADGGMAWSSPVWVRGE